MKRAINMYFLQIVTVLGKHKIKWHDPEATIKLEKYPTYGSVGNGRKKSRNFNVGSLYRIAGNPDCTGSVQGEQKRIYV